MNKVVVALFHTYARDGELGSFMDQLAQSFGKLGVNLHVIIANDLVGALSNTGYKIGISEDKVISHINSLKPDFVLNTNRAGITKKLLSEVECPIITWMVDRTPFLHHGGDHEDVFSESDIVVGASTAALSYYEKTYPVLKGRTHLLPFATTVSDFQEKREKTSEIVFVGTYFYGGDRLTKIIETCAERSTESYRNLLLLMRELENDYSTDFTGLLAKFNLSWIPGFFSIAPLAFRGLLANTISLNHRVKYLDSVSDMGLELYGTKNWLNANQFSYSLLNAFHPNTFIKTREQLVDLYQRSKLSLNVSHLQAEGGLPYRIYDIMASDSLLISEYDSRSDIFKFFGNDNPLPMYRSTSELRKIVKHFLVDDVERGDLIKLSNELISKGYDFKDRVKDLYKLAGKPLDLDVTDETGSKEITRKHFNPDQITLDEKVGDKETQMPKEVAQTVDVSKSEVVKLEGNIANKSNCKNANSSGVAQDEYSQKPNVDSMRLIRSAPYLKVNSDSVFHDDAIPVRFLVIVMPVLKVLVSFTIKCLNKFPRLGFFVKRLLPRRLKELLLLALLFY